MGVALFIVSYLVVYIMALALLMYSGLFTNFLSILNIIYSAAGELVNPIGTVFFTPFILLCSALPIKPKRLSKAEQEQFSLSQKEKEIVVGLLLGDLGAEKQNVNTRFRFIQSIIHKEYLLALY